MTSVKCDSVNNRENQDNGKKRILFLVNPASGSGRAVQLFKRKVMPLLSEASDRIEHQVLVTTARNSAFIYLKKLDIQELLSWNGIVIVSGDGLLFEVFNALLSRSDWQQAIQVPIGIIPAGSGNGLAYSISYANGEVKQDQVIAATKNVLSGKTIPMDIVKVQNSHNVYYSFLSLGWGLIADIDIESERLRILGGNRFTVWALIRTLSLRRYPGRLHFLPVPGYEYNAPSASTNASSANRKKANKKSHRRRSRTIISQQSNESNDSSCELHFSSSTSSASTQSKKTKKMTKMRNSRSFSLNLKSRFRKGSTIDACEEAIEHCPQLSKSKGHIPSDYLDVQLTKYKQLNVNDSDESPSMERDRQITLLSNKLNCLSTPSSPGYDAKSSDSIGNTSDLPESPVDYSDAITTENDIMPKLTDPVPSQWKTVEGDFVLVYATYQTHISHDCIFAPNAKPDDNVIWLLYLSGNLTRKQVLQFLLKLETGAHVDLPFVNVIPVQAFRLEPLSSKSRVTVDGELIETETLQAEIMPCAARMLCK